MDELVESEIDDIFDKMLKSKKINWKSVGQQERADRRRHEASEGSGRTSGNLWRKAKDIGRIIIHSLKGWFPVVATAIFTIIFGLSMAIGTKQHIAVNGIDLAVITIILNMINMVSVSSATEKRFIMHKVRDKRKTAILIESLQDEAYKRNRTIHAIDIEHDGLDTYLKIQF